MRICILLSVLLFMGHAAFCQNTYKMGITDNYLIKNALVVSKPGAAPVKQDILIEDGIIKSVGPNQKLPLNTLDLSCDSMYIYAGFIAGASYIGIKAPEEKKDAPKPPSRDEATFEQSGITPQVSALSQLNASDKSIEDFRKAGFTVAQVFPKGGMIPGQSAIISLKMAKDGDELVISDAKNLLSTFTSSRLVAPSTQIGVMARYRNLYKNAELADKNILAYKTNPVGLKAPSFSEEITALIPFQKKERNVYFLAPKAKDIYRASALQKELGYNLYLLDVKHIGDAMDLVKSAKLPVLVSIDLPEKEEEKGGKSEKGKKPDEKAAEKETKESNPELDSLKAKKNAAIKAYEEEAGMLEKAGISFTFSLLDSKATDISKTLQRIVEAGLSKDAALAALTTTPASWLGLSKTHGTIEQGKVANLVITDKPLFDKEGKIKMVMIEGRLFDGLVADKAPAEAGKGGSIEGSWTYVTLVQGGEENGTFKFTKDGNSYKGVVISDRTSSAGSEIKDLVLKDNKLSGYTTVDADGAIKVDFNLTFDGSKFTGKVNVPGMGSFDISGSKKPDNNEF